MQSSQWPQCAAPSRSFSHAARWSGVLLLAFLTPSFGQSPERGIQNFYEVDQHVYRGGQPTKEGFDYLSKLGVKTVIDLREAEQRSKEEEELVTSAGMKYVNVPMTGLKPPTETETSKILGILEDGTAGPVFVHCKRGADRTGAVIAAYRIDHDGWNNKRALKEAMERGMSHFQLPRQGYIRSFQPRTIEAKAPAAEAPAAALSGGAPAAASGGAQGAASSAVTPGAASSAVTPGAASSGAAPAAALSGGAPAASPGGAQGAAASGATLGAALSSGAPAAASSPTTLGAASSGAAPQPAFAQ